MKALILLALLITPVYAKDVAQHVGTNGITVTLTDEDCTLKQHVVNLPERARWVEKGEVFDGCYSIDPQYGFVMLYFDDLTMVIGPLQSFKPVSSI